MDLVTWTLHTSVSTYEVDRNEFRRARFSLLGQSVYLVQNNVFQVVSLPEYGRIVVELCICDVPHRVNAGPLHVWVHWFNTSLLWVYVIDGDLLHPRRPCHPWCVGGELRFLIFPMGSASSYCNCFVDVVRVHDPDVPFRVQSSLLWKIRCKKEEVRQWHLRIQNLHLQDTSTYRLLMSDMHNVGGGGLGELCNSRRTLSLRGLFSSGGAWLRYREGRFDSLLVLGGLDGAVSFEGHDPVFSGMHCDELPRCFFFGCNVV